MVCNDLCKSKLYLPHEDSLPLKLRITSMDSLGIDKRHCKPVDYYINKGPKEIQSQGYKTCFDHASYQTERLAYLNAGRHSIEVQWNLGFPPHLIANLLLRSCLL